MKQTLKLHGRSHRFLLKDGVVWDFGSDPIPGLAAILNARQRIVFGTVLSDGGTDDAGSGDWSCEWSNSGAGAPGYPALNIYTFTVSPVFNAAIKNVLATGSNNNAASDTTPDAYFVGADSSLADVGTFTVMTWNQIGDAADGSFSFAAFEDPA